MITPNGATINPQLIADLELEIGNRQPHKAGSEILFLCPAHADIHPSARWHTQKHVWHCDACGAGGGAKQLAISFGFDLAKYKQAKAQAQTRRIVATYEYRDESGALLFESVRYEPKSFTQRQPDGQGGWLWDLKGVRRVPYKLPELLAADKALLVFNPEGEKDVDRLAALGLVATTNPQGAGKWRAEYSPFLAGRHVVILPDNDEVGRKHSEQVARAVAPLAASIKIVNLPGLAEKGDVSDWLAAGHTADDLTALVDAAPVWQAEAPKPTGEDTPRETDVGNAMRLVARYGADFKFCEAFGWLSWDGKRWVRNATGAIHRAATETTKSIFAEAAAAKSDTRARELGEHALKSQSAGRIGAMIELAMYDLAVAVEPSDFDADPWLLNCENGLLDLRTGILGTHDRAALATKLAPVAYDPTAHLAMWDNFLADSTGGDTELVAFLQRAAGYSLTGSTSEEVILFLSGVAATGKSTFLEALKATMGTYATTADFQTFIKSQHSRDGGAASPDIADLAGARLVVSIEVDQGKELAEALVKTLSGGDTVRARNLYKNGFEFLPQFTMWLAANHQPKVDDQDEAMWRRIRRAPFEHVVPEERRDPKVKATLRDPKAGGPAILAWAVQGCLAWQRDGLGIPPVIRAATAAYRLDMDPLKDFLPACCEVKPDAWTPAAALRKAYEDFSKEGGDRDVLSGKSWGVALRAHGFAEQHNRQGPKTVRGWRGLRLLDAPEQDGLDLINKPEENVTPSEMLRDVTPNSQEYNSNPIRGDFRQNGVTSRNTPDRVTSPDSIETPDAFTPSDAWQPVPAHVVLPNGLETRATFGGAIEARLAQKPTDSCSVCGGGDWAWSDWLTQWRCTTCYPPEPSATNVTASADLEELEEGEL